MGTIRAGYDTHGGAYSPRPEVHGYYQAAELERVLQGRFRDTPTARTRRAYHRARARRWRRAQVWPGV